MKRFKKVVKVEVLLMPNGDGKINCWDKGFDKLVEMIGYSETAKLPLSFKVGKRQKIKTFVVRYHNGDSSCPCCSEAPSFRIYSEAMFQKYLTGRKR